jgi:hypothetical protein
MVEGVTLGTSQLVPPRSAGLLEKRIFDKSTLPPISCQRGDSNGRPPKHGTLKPLKGKILRFKSFRNNILARPGQRSSIVTPYSPKIWTSNPPKKIDPD